MAHTLLAVLIVAVLAISHGVNAKRGCSSFGHSCFGGHGKRSGDTGSLDITNQVTRQMGQQEIPPHPEYPNYNALQPGDDIIPIRDGGAFDHENRDRDVMKYKLRNIFKHWMDTYRRSQLVQGGYDVEDYGS